jgi:P-type Ca2+ transporter type 2C
MDRPPRPPSERLFNATVVRRFLFLGLIQSIGVVFAFFWKIDSAHLAFSDFTVNNETYREAITMVQAGIVLSQFFNGFSVRTDEQSLFKVGVFSNVPLIGAELFGLVIISAISYLPVLQGVFHTAPLTVYDWLMLASFGFLLLVADELRKAYVRGRKRRSGTPITSSPVGVAAAQEA